MTNIVGCIPREAKRTTDHRPPDDAIKACSPRVTDFIDMCQPRLVVAVGKLAATWLDQDRKHGIRFVTRVPIFEIAHPASILRTNIAGQGLAIQRATITLRNAVTMAMIGMLRSTSPVRVLKPKAKDIPTRKTTKKTNTAPTDIRRSTFSSGTIGDPLTRCRVCRRPITKPQLGPGPYCDTHRPPTEAEIGPDGNSPPF